MAILDVDTAGKGLLEATCDLEDLFGNRLACEQKDHDVDSAHHDVGAPATVRGYAPCGDTMNICAKFAKAYLNDGWMVIPCECGKRHLSSQFRFIAI